MLDIGAGTGVVASRVIETTGADVYAVEPDGKRAAKMAAKYPNVRTSMGSAERLPFTDSRFDKAYATMSLHHFADLDSALGEVSRVLKHGGRFVVTEIEPGSSRGMLFRLFASLKGEWLNLMTKDQLSAKIVRVPHFGNVQSERQDTTYLIQALRS